MNIIDLSYPIEHTMPVYPGDTQPVLSLDKSIEKDGYQAYILQTGLHVGTHIDAPLHLLPVKKTIADYPLDHFCGKGIVLNIKNGISEDDIEKIEQDMIVLIDTGWNLYDPNYFKWHPPIPESLINLFIQRKIKMVGMDCPSPDYPPHPLHKKLMENEIFILENITNLSQLHGYENFTICAAPLILKAEASLVRAFAIIEK